MSVLQLSKFLPLNSKMEYYPFESTFVRLRYSLGGHRPSQTTRQPLFVIKTLEFQKLKSGISPIIIFKK